jgi:hypothetical protein
VLGIERAERADAGGAVEVQDVEPVAASEADVGLGLLRPSGLDAGAVAGRLGEAVGDELAEGRLPTWAQARSPHEQPSCQPAAGGWSAGTGRAADGPATGWCNGSTGMPRAA